MTDILEKPRHIGKWCAVVVLLFTLDSTWVIVDSREANGLWQEATPSSQENHVNSEEAWECRIMRTYFEMNKPANDNDGYRKQLSNIVRHYG